jgi:hypothetical protein
MFMSRRGLGGLALIAALTLSSCGLLPDAASQTPPTTVPREVVPSSAPASASPSAKPTRSKGAVRNDLRAGTLSRNFSVSGLSVRVTYSTPLKVAQWTPDVSKPLNVSLTTYANRRTQKIYLTRVRANIGVSDGAGSLQAPAPLLDEANISPGFIVTAPNSYGQIFVVPAVDSGALYLTIDFTYEFLLQVSPKSRDYEKQTARDSITVPLS